MSDINKVVFILYKYSVVVRGMEKRLTESGFIVSTIADDYKKITDFAKEEVVFVIYLPEDITRDKLKQETLEQICYLVDKTSNCLLVIGEEHFRDEIRAANPVLARHRWESRPIDMEKLPELLRDIIRTGPESAATETNGSQKRILIVDDDPSYAGMVMTWIKDIYKTDIVTAGMQAITFLLKNPVDIILLDYEMPVVDGPQVLQMLRQEESTRDIPVVFLTGVSSKEGVSRVMELKPDGYILKSTTRDDLLKYLGNLLG